MLKNKVSQYFRSMQQQLFPEFESQLGPTTNKHREVITALDMVSVEQFLPYRGCSEAGRPPRVNEQRSPEPLLQNLFLIFQLHWVLSIELRSTQFYEGSVDFLTAFPVRQPFQMHFLNFLIWNLAPRHMKHL